jgi:glycosyltransferase involved in cell wall biosynthesis
MKRKHNTQIRKKFSVIIPFAKYDEEFKHFLASLNNQKRLNEFELIFVHNNQKSCPEIVHNIREQLHNLMEGQDIKFYNYKEKFGPSQAWCFGIKCAKGTYICLVASDCRLDPNWTSEILKHVAPENGKVYLGRFDESINKSALSRIEIEIDRNRFRNGVIDFRNFIAEGQLLRMILKKNFNNNYFSDVELNTIIKKLKIEIIKLYSLRLKNNYPNGLSESINRKFKHGVACGRIYKCFELPLKSKTTLKDILLPFMALGEFIYQASTASLSLSDKGASIYLDFVFYLGILYGFVCPKKLIKSFYTFHFDE